MGKPLNGGVIGVTNTPTSNKASGIWSLAEQARWKKAGTWPAVATFSLSSSAASVSEGDSFTITLTTTGVADGTPVPYTVTGISAGDLSSGSLTGNITVTSGTGTVSFTVASDGAAESTETFTLTAGTASVNVTILDTPIADTYFNRTILLLPGNGTNGAQNNTFLDSSTNNFTVTRNGDVKQGTFSPFSQTGWSGYFDGNGDYLTLANSSNFSCSGNFTIEIFAYPTAISNTPVIFDTRTAAGNTASIYLYINTSGNIVAVVGGTSITSSSTYTVNSWYYIAIVRSSNSVTLYVNGTSAGTATISTNLSDTGMTIGAPIDQRVATATNKFTGYLSNFRFNNTTARTISSTPTSALSSDSGTTLLTLQSNRFVDNASSATITVAGETSIQAFSPFAPTAAYSAATNGGSGYWDGDIDGLSVGSSTQFNLGTNDFTIEGWMYTGSTRGGTDDALITNWSGTWAANFWSVHNHHATQNNKISFWVHNISSSAAIMVSTTNPNSNQWVHFVIVRSGSSFAMFINGKREATYTSSAALNSAASPIYIGGPVTSNEYLGYMSNVRILNGTAAYSPGDANITVPTAPFTNSSNPNTKLLLNFTNAAVIDSTGKSVMSTSGNAQISTTQSKWGGASMYFDGTGDSVYVEPSQLTSFGTADFTIEGWVRINAFTQTSGVVCNNWTSSTWASNFWSLHCDHPNQNEKFSFFVYNIDSVNALMASSTTIAVNTWYHVAVTRVGSTFRLFVNGVQEATYTSATSIDGGTLKPIYVGGGPSADQASNSYIDDLRVTKYARYTSNFTAPTAAFELR